MKNKPEQLKPYSSRFHPIFTYSPTEKKVRLFAFIWHVGVPGINGGYSNRLSFSLIPSLFRFRKELWGWGITLFGFRVHRKKSYGGWF